MEANRDLHTFKECQRNFAATMGKITHDGCGEFMKNTHILESLLCEACGCHCSFHRKVEVDGVLGVVFNVQPLNQHVGERNNGTIKNIFVRNSETIESESKPVTNRRKRNCYTDEETKNMREFADFLEWKMHGGNKELRNKKLQFCNRMGISKMQFKSCLHSHKKLWLPVDDH